MATVADLLVTKLANAGVRMLFGVPGGGSNLEVIEAAGRRGVPFVLTATETGAAIAALAQAEMTGAPGACLTTLGPGATSVVNGVACAFLDRAPLVVLTDAHTASAGGRFEHQRIDHAALQRPITVWQATLTADGAGAIVDEALARSMRPRPGPVHVDCPGDVAASSATGRGEAARRGVPAAEIALDSETERIVSRARKPILLIGLGARRPDDAAAIRAFCERRRVPALVTYKAKGVVSDDDEWFGGVFTNGRIEQALLGGSDLLIGAGLDPVELLPRTWPYPQPIVYCGRWPVDDRQVPFAAQLIGDIQVALAAFERSLQSEWKPADVRAAVERQRAAIAIKGAAMTAQDVVRVASGQLSASSRVVVDAGAHMFPATMLWPVAEPNGMLISNGLSTMGFALPAAIGAALLDRERTVVALTGDGGLLMCAGELLTAVRERLKIIVVVFSDRSLSLIEIKQQAKRYRPDGVALGDIAWPSLATSVGLAGFRAATDEELARAIDDARRVDGPALIEARIDRGNYGETLRAIRG